MFCAEDVGARGNFTTEDTEEDKKGNADGQKWISGAIVDAAMKVHSALGPGLLESAHLTCLRHELIKRGLTVCCEVPLSVVYDGVRLEAGYRLDLLVEDTVVVELKAVEALAPIHQAQIISYLKLSGKPIGLLINFHSLHLKDGIKRFVA
ncbi:MAG TPA: GxxExxY protein [Pyrinomonadaceae bacterium]|nr:GxxExxY protein [Pyrinomonadaceae bacterium]